GDATLRPDGLCFLEPDNTWFSHETRAYRDGDAVRSLNVEDGSQSVRDQLERLMPPGGRARLLVGWGVVAWATIGGLLLLWAVARVLSRVAGVFPYLVVAAIVVLILNPAVRRLARLGLPRRLAATIVFVGALTVTVLALSFMVPILIHQFQH